MNKFTKVLSLCMCIAIIMAALPLNFSITASALTEDIYTYTVSGGEATITDCDTSASGSITIPDTLGGYPVTIIGEYAFYYCTSLTSITIPAGVTNIGDSAFNYCTSLESITIPDCVTSIGFDAFRFCKSLKSVTIPDSVVSIGSYAFDECISLTSVYITDIAAWCSIDFAGYRSNPLYYAEELYVNETFTTNIVIPDDVTSIGSYAFYGCDILTSITIGNSVTSIGSYAFDECTSLTSIYITDIAAWCSIDFAGYRSNPLYYAKNLYVNGIIVKDLIIPDSVTSIGDSAFEYCTSIESVTILDGVISIGNDAFYNCTSLKSITIPDSVTSIGEYAFNNTIWIKTWYDNQPDGMVYLGKVAYKYKGTCPAKIDLRGDTKGIAGDAFYNCTSLISITIPDGVNNIGDFAFEYCTSLESVTIPDNVTSIGSYAFDECTSLTSVTIPDGVISIGNGAFRNCISLKSITIPDSVTSIGEYAFGNCTSLILVNYNAKNCIIFGSRSYPTFEGCLNLTTVNIGENVQKISEYAFYKCTSIETVNFNAVNCIEMGNYSRTVFTGCSNLATVNIADKVKNIPDHAFRNCAKITSLTIPESVIRIGIAAFYNCTSLESVTIGDGVTSIGDNAFGYCDSLTGVYITDIAAWSGIDFVDYDSNPLNYAKNLYINGTLATNVVIPDNTTSIGDYAFFNCASLTSVTIPDSVVSIDDSAFCNCTSLTSIIIPDSITSIGGYAFRGCTSLTSITIPDSITSVGDYAFYNCSLLEWIAIPDSVTSIGDYAFYSCTKLKYVYYLGKQEHWENISIGNSNYPLTNATKYYNMYVNGVYRYTLTDDKATITGLITSIDGNIIIPDTLNGYPVTGIGAYAFYNCSSLTSVTIPDSVTSIGEDAFYNTAWYNNQSDGMVYLGKVAYKYKGTCPTSIELRSDTKGIAAGAFQECTSLTSITIPDSVTRIDSLAFASCRNLRYIRLSKNISYIGQDAFSGCYNLSKVYFCATEQEKAKINIEDGNNYLLQNEWIYHKDHIYTLTDATCDENGYILYECEICGRISDHHYTYPAGHIFENGTCELCGIVNNVDYKTLSAVENAAIKYGIINNYTDLSQSSGTIVGGIVYKNSVAMQSYESMLKNGFADKTNIPYVAYLVDAPSAGKYWISPTFSLGGTYSGNGYYFIVSVNDKDFYKYNVSETGWFSPEFEVELEKGINIIRCIARVKETSQIVSSGTWVNQSNLRIDSSLTGVLPGESLVLYPGQAEYYRYKRSTIESHGTENYLVGCGECSHPYVDYDTLSVAYMQYIPHFSYTVNAPKAGYYDISIFMNTGVIGATGYITVFVDNKRYDLYFIDCGKAYNNLSVYLPEGAHTITITSVWDHTGGIELIGADNVASWCDYYELRITGLENGAVTKYENQVMPSEYAKTTSGTISGNIEWSLNLATGLLSINGNGEMENFTSGNAPWYTVRSYIKSLYISSGIKSIGAFAFADCISLTSITVPDNVTSIGANPFYGCTSLESINVDADNTAYTSVNGVLLNKDKSILICYPAGKKDTAYIIPDSVTSIGEGAFYNCTSFASITMPDSVTSIDADAFHNCNSLTDVYYSGTQGQWNNISIGSYNIPLTSATIHYNYGSEDITESGDIDGDGVIGAEDLTEMVKILLGETVLDESKQTLADANKDGIVDLLDLLRMKLIIAGMI